MENPARARIGWLDWVTVNLGGPPDRAQHAAEAAQDALSSGAGLNAAMAAAINRWVECGQGQKPFWEMTFWGIWFRRHAWLFALFAGMGLLFLHFPLGWIAVLALTPLPLAATVWHFYVTDRLSKHGIVAPGVLVAVSVRDSDGGEVYTGTYQWHFNGPHLVKQGEPISDDVLVLFDPAYPNDAIVINRSFSTSRL